MTASGTRSARSKSPTRRIATLGHLSSGLGMLGCMEAQVHNRMVAIQLLIMSPRDLHPSGSLQEDAGG
jgi:hypothetical protein